MNLRTNSFGTMLSSLEKEWFPWRKNRLVSGKPAFFPGCNLVNFLPATAREAIEAFNRMECGWLYDCCSKPLQLAGNSVGARRVLERINRQLREAAVTELIVACPNCHATFERELEIPVRDIYAFFHEKKHPCAITAESIRVFPPCPDRKTGAIGQSVAGWTGSEILPAEALPCCGLAIGNPLKARRAVETIRADMGPLTPYCASCYGHLCRNGIPMTPHILTKGMGLAETPSKGIRQGLNRTKPLLWK